MGVFMRAFAARLKQDGHNDILVALDIGVYSIHRNMRMFGSFKADDQTKTPFTPLDDLTAATDFSLCCIQSDTPLQQISISDDLRVTLEPQSACKANHLTRARTQGISVKLDKFPPIIRNAMERHSQSVCHGVSLQKPKVSGVEGHCRIR